MPISGIKVQNGSFIVERWLGLLLTIVSLSSLGISLLFNYYQAIYIAPLRAEVANLMTAVDKFDAGLATIEAKYDNRIDAVAKTVEAYKDGQASTIRSIENKLTESTTILNIIVDDLKILKQRAAR